MFIAGVCKEYNLTYDEVMTKIPYNKLLLMNLSINQAIEDVEIPKLNNSKKNTTKKPINLEYQANGVPQPIIF